jgi:hypothetical protein
MSEHSTEHARIDHGPDNIGPTHALTADEQDGIGTGPNFDRLPFQQRSADAFCGVLDVDHWQQCGSIRAAASYLQGAVELVAAYMDLATYLPAHSADERYIP